MCEVKEYEDNENKVYIKYHLFQAIITDIVDKQAFIRVMYAHIIYLSSWSDLFHYYLLNSLFYAKKILTSPKNII